MNSIQKFKILKAEQGLPPLPAGTQVLDAQTLYDDVFVWVSSPVEAGGVDNITIVTVPAGVRFDQTGLTFIATVKLPPERCAQDFLHVFFKKDVA